MRSIRLLLFTGFVLIPAALEAATYAVKQSSTAYPLVFFMVDSTDHVTGKTGLTPTVTLSKAGGSFASPSGTVSEIGSGWYQVAGNATDTGTLGALVLHATGTGADPVDQVYEVVAVDPQDPAPPVDLVEISGDSSAADNLETMLDGTGGDLDLSTLTVTGGATISNSAGTALTIDSTGGFGARGISISGHGLGEGVAISGGSHGDGVIIEAGTALFKTGLQVLASNGNAVEFNSTGGNGSGLGLSGNGSGNGLAVLGGATGNAVELIGGSTSGHGLFARAQGDGSHGVSALGMGTGEGILATGGASGNGLELDGGASGDDIVLTGNDWPDLTTLLRFVLDDGTATYDRETDSLQAQRDHFDSVLDGAPTFGEAMDEQGYTSDRADKLDNLDMSLSELRASMPTLFISTTIATLTSQTKFTLADGPPDDNAINGSLVVVTDNADGTRKAVGVVQDYDGTGKEVTLVVDPGTFTMAPDDKVDVIAGGAAIPLWLRGARP